MQVTNPGVLSNFRFENAETVRFDVIVQKADASWPVVLHGHVRKASLHWLPPGLARMIAEYADCTTEVYEDIMPTSTPIPVNAGDVYMVRATLINSSSESKCTRLLDLSGGLEFVPTPIA